MKSPRRPVLVGSVVAILGMLIALNGLVAGPHAFWLGWRSVVGSVVAGLLLVGSGVLIARDQARPARSSQGEPDPPSDYTG